jgi:hypothetical protein
MVVSDVLASAGGLLQPNEFDRKRIQLAVAARKRYRFVKAAVRPAEGGFRIESPCCSRRVDPNGGVVNIALLLYREPGVWQLYGMDRETAGWLLHRTYEKLGDLLEELKTDAGQLFWQ